MAAAELPVVGVGGGVETEVCGAWTEPIFADASSHATVVTHPLVATRRTSSSIRSVTAQVSVSAKPRNVSRCQTQAGAVSPGGTNANRGSRASIRHCRVQMQCQARLWLRGGSEREAASTSELLPPGGEGY